MFTKSQKKVSKKQLVTKSRHLIPLKDSETAQLMIELFIKPLMNVIELRRLDMRKRLDLIFGTDHRHILYARAEENFLMPGNLIYGAVIDAPSPDNKVILKGDRMLVRIDDRTPNRIDIEVLKTGLVFLLTKRHYSEIVCKLKGNKKCRISLKYPFLG